MTIYMDLILLVYILMNSWMWVSVWKERAARRGRDEESLKLSQELLASSDKLLQETVSLRNAWNDLKQELGINRIEGS